MREDQSFNKLIMCLLNKKINERKCSLQQLKLEEELKQMEANKGKQIKALDTIKGALNQMAARKKVTNLKMDKINNILHFKKEAAKSTFRGLLKTNDKRLGVRGFTVKVPLSEKAKVREAVKKKSNN
jgi:hypothetical protein